MIRFIILFLLFSLQYSYAQWESAGWRSDGYLTSMTVCNGTIIKAEGNDIMTSSDLGTTWQKVSEFKSNISDFARNDNSILVSAFYNDGVYISSDCGLSWELISKGIKAMSSILISGDTIVAGDSWSANIYVSTNLGETWEVKSSGLPSTGELTVSSIALKNETIFACVGGKGNTGLYKSSDFGETWEYQGAETRDASTVFIHSGRVYVYSKGLKFSEDMGETWTAVTLGESVRTINGNADKLYAGTSNGVYCSLDDGNNWIDYGLKGVSVKDIDFIDDKVVASSSRSLYILESSDEDWQLLDTLIDFGAPTIFAIKDDLIYAYCSSEGGKQIRVSDDIGETWELLNPMTKINNVSSFAAINDKLYLGSSSLFDGGLYTSIDNAKSWELHEQLAEFTDNKIIRTFSLAFIDSYIILGTAKGLFRSFDNGETWSRPGVPPDISSIRGFVVLDNKLFDKKGGIIQFTTDYGETWIEKEGNGLPPHGWGESSFFAYDNTLLLSYNEAGENSGVYISKDRGDNWQYITKEFFFYEDLFGTKDVYSSHAFDNYIFACTSSGIFVTIDEGENWVHINEGLPDLTIYAIKRVGDYLIVGTSGGFSRAKISDIADIIITAVPEELPIAQESSVYPNPTDAYLHIDKYEGSPMDYEIFDYAGKKVLSGTLNGYNIDVSALPAAAYIIVLDDGADTHAMKFIKK